jgi:hypothetical protein
MEVLRPQGREHFTINAAFTGQAAQEMERASDRPGFTVDALLNARARGEGRGSSAEGVWQGGKAGGRG